MVRRKSADLLGDFGSPRVWALLSHTNKYKGMSWFRQGYGPNNKRAVVGYTTLKGQKQ